MATKYTPYLIADWFMGRVNTEAGDTISPLKLQKLVYYAQAWHLAVFKEPLFDEPIEAWTHGPAVRSLYGRFFGILRESNIPIKTHLITIPEFEPRTEELLIEIQEIYGERSASFLRDLTHGEKPWQIARGNTPSHAQSNAVISHASMMEFYSALNKK